MQKTLNACNRLRAIIRIRLQILLMIWQYGVAGGSLPHEKQRVHRLRKELELYRLDLGSSRLDRRWRS